jgi:hypothetical protein
VNSFTKRPETIRGKLGEDFISLWLRARGCTVLPAYEIEISTGKGPRLFTACDGLVVSPDLLVFGGKEVFWAEVKNKSSFTYYRKTRTWQDGIDRRHWLDYLKVKKITGKEVWLFFLHLPDQPLAKDTPANMIPPTGLFAREIGHLESNIDHEFEDFGHGGMVYWRQQDLRVFVSGEKLIALDRS